MHHAVCFWTRAKVATTVVGNRLATAFALCHTTAATDVWGKAHAHGRTRSCTRPNNARIRHGLQLWLACIIMMRDNSAWLNECKSLIHALSACQHPNRLDFSVYVYGRRCSISRMSTLRISHVPGFPGKAPASGPNRVKLLLNHALPGERDVPCCWFVCLIRA